MTSASNIVCPSCIGEEAVHLLLTSCQREVLCSYCGSEEPGATIEEVADAIAPFLEQHYEVVEVHYHHDNEGWEGYFQECASDNLENVLQLELGIDWNNTMELAEDLVTQLEFHIHRGEHECFFDRQQQCHRRFLDAQQHEEDWAKFSNRLKHKRRFFDSEMQTKLGNILGGLGALERRELPVLEIAPEDDEIPIFRARCADSEADALKFSKDPERELCPPQSDKTTSGRMNPEGIAVFYGALSVRTAIAEVRPPVGSFVVVSRFKPNRSLKLLDMSRIGVLFTGSIFAPEYEDRQSRLRFLEGFHQLIAKPVLPKSESLDYLPTQAVAEYVGNVLGLDGILFASSQVGALPDEYEAEEPKNHFSPDDCEYRFSEGHNVVLFGPASIVTSEENGAGVLEVISDSVDVHLINGITFDHRPCSIYDPDGPHDF